MHLLTLPRRGLLVRWAARAGLLFTCLVIVTTMAPVRADAHPLSTTAVLLDAAPNQVTGKVQLPIDRLAIALDQPLTAATVAQPAKLEELRLSLIHI